MRVSTEVHVHLKYFAEEARKRNCDVTGLVTRILSVVGQDQMVSAVLDDAEEVARVERRRAAAPHRASGRSVVVKERMNILVDYVTKHGKLCMSEFDPDPPKWYPALRRLLSEGVIVARPRELGTKKIYYVLAEQQITPLAPTDELLRETT